MVTEYINILRPVHTCQRVLSFLPITMNVIPLPFMTATTHNYMHTRGVNAILCPGIAVYMAVIALHVHTLQVVACLDDLNMAAVDSYGSQPCSELLRQLMNDGGWYDRKHLTWKVGNTDCIPRILPAVFFFQRFFQQLFFSAVVFFFSRYQPIRHGHFNPKPKSLLNCILLAGS